VPRPYYVCSAMNTLLNRIIIDPKVCGGKPCVRGTRIWVSLTYWQIEWQKRSCWLSILNSCMKTCSPQSPMGRKPHASASYRFRPTGSREIQARREHRTPWPGASEGIRPCPQPTRSTGALRRFKRCGEPQRHPRQRAPMKRSDAARGPGLVARSGDTLRSIRDS
jgi:Protein of unknown function (DUF433)